MDRSTGPDYSDPVDALAKRLCDKSEGPGQWEEAWSEDAVVDGENHEQEIQAFIEAWRNHARFAATALADAGFAVIRDEPDHYVTFDASGWFIEHSVACRVAGTLGTCEYNEAIRLVADDMDGPDPDLFGRHRITEIDSEGLPSLERA